MQVTEVTLLKDEVDRLQDEIDSLKLSVAKIRLTLQARVEELTLTKQKLTCATFREEARFRLPRLPPPPPPPPPSPMV
jgi:hypothetical protein